MGTIFLAHFHGRFSGYESTLKIKGILLHPMEVTEDSKALERGAKAGSGEGVGKRDGRLQRLVTRGPRSVRSAVF